jgi:hypothetical protein
MCPTTPLRIPNRAENRDARLGLQGLSETWAFVKTVPEAAISSMTGDVGRW